MQLGEKRNTRRKDWYIDRLPLHQPSLSPLLPPPVTTPATAIAAVEFFLSSSSFPSFLPSPFFLVSPLLSGRGNETLKKGFFFALYGSLKCPNPLYWVSFFSPVYRVHAFQSKIVGSTVGTTNKKILKVIAHVFCVPHKLYSNYRWAHFLICQIFYFNQILSI